MKDGFVKVAALTPNVVVADPAANIKDMIIKAEEMAAVGVKLLVFPELSVTGYTCGDLFLTDTLLAGAKDALYDYLYKTAELDIVSILGMPIEHGGRIYNAAVVVSGGRVLGVVPKTSIPGHNEHLEPRYFAEGEPDMGEIRLGDDSAPFGTALLFQDTWIPEFSFSVEICDDLWMSDPPSVSHVGAGAYIIANLSAASEIVGKAEYCRSLVNGQSARLVCCYIYAGAGEGESTTGMVFAGHDMIAENGRLLAEKKPFSDGYAVMTETDLYRLKTMRRRLTTFKSTSAPEKMGYRKIVFDIGAPTETILTRAYNRFPFVPKDQTERAERADEITHIQAAALAGRMKHIGCEDVVVGLSGGLDSTLALLVCVDAFERLGLDKKGIHTITMPCFGTTDRTHDNAVRLANALGTDLKEIDIKKSVLSHFADIGQAESDHDVTFENAQARERTQVLMDIANMVSGLVIGTGDLSELALGWCTFGGDQLSMYGVNASVPKTLVRALVQFYADRYDGTVRDVLTDILDTPVSPELLPPEDGEISQRTEDIVGPYELHDFFLYHMMRTGAGAGKLLRLALYAFGDEYDEALIRKWLDIFMKRFFSQQYKRSCMPDGPMTGTVALSAGGTWRMPSDAADTLWRL